MINIARFSYSKQNRALQAERSQEHPGVNAESRPELIICSISALLNSMTKKADIVG